ncbi:MAG: hypothetical protein KAQ69_02870 [Spirochaetales bacterium]|nr:hypothetical protein [Spirochaetales bacterium]
MPYSLFHDRFPDVAERETRTVTVIDSSAYNLPSAQYAFLEMFCDEPGCDCRRVFLSVVSPLKKDILAVIAWGWEEREFYIKWIGDDNLYTINDLIGPTLNSASPQSNLAPALLNLFRKLLIQDTIFVERVKRHYAMFRREIDNKTSRVVQGKKKRRQKRKKR